MTEKEAAALTLLASTEETEGDLYVALVLTGGLIASSALPLLRDMEARGWVKARNAGPVPEKGLPARTLWTATDEGRRALASHRAPMPTGPGVYREG